MPAPVMPGWSAPTGRPPFPIHQVPELPQGPGVTVYFEHEQLDERVAELQRLGVVFDELPTDQSWLWREARLRDPAGNQLVLFYGGENRKNPPWRV